jgi:FkbM family methyltransferase
MITRIVHAVFRRLGFAPRNRKQENLDKIKDLWLQQLNIDFIFDIGASDGGFANKIKTTFPLAEVHSFEALKNSFEALKKNTTHLQSFYPNHVALSNTKGTIDFYLCDDYTGSSSMLEMGEIHKDAYPFTSKNTLIQVEAITLDEYSERLNLDQRNILLKLDVQGAEKIVLEGAKKTLEKVDVIFTEINFSETYKNCVLFKDLNALLESHNFYLTGMENVSRNYKDGSFLQADAYYLKK